MPCQTWWLEGGDPLHSHLTSDVLPQLGLNVSHPAFTVSRAGGQHGVYLYQEQNSHAIVVGKFYGDRHGIPKTVRERLLDLEFSRLSTARAAGFDRSPHQVVQPLSKSKRINCVLVEKFARGHDLDHYIAKAAYDGQGRRLFRKLSKLAHFLCELHNRTAGPERVDFRDNIAKFRLLLDVLLRDGVADGGASDSLRRQARGWERKERMWSDVAVWVHGDATPTNFFFHSHDGVTAIDLERMRRTDRAYDVGMLSAELKHHFAWRTGRADMAEPFIGHFLWSYAANFQDREAAFRAVLQRSRFYMALAELRLARNDWLPWEHRKWLVAEAGRCLA